MRQREQEAATLAHNLILFADGAQEAGLTTYAQRARVVATDLQWALEQLAAERAVREELQARNAAMLQILANRVFCQACARLMRQAAA